MCLQFNDDALYFFSTIVHGENYLHLFLDGGHKLLSMLTEPMEMRTFFHMLLRPGIMSLTCMSP